MDWKEEDLHGMKNPSPQEWPLYPLLPLKNYEMVPKGDSPRFGMLFAHDRQPVVYLGRIPDFDAHQHLVEREDVAGFKAVEIVAEPMTPEETEPLREKLASCQKLEYATFEDLQVAGWMVD